MWLRNVVGSLLRSACPFEARWDLSHQSTKAKHIKESGMLCITR